MVQDATTQALPSQFRVVVKLKNNRLIRAREARGWTQHDLAQAADVTNNEVCALETLRAAKGPVRRNGAFRPAALKIAAALEVRPTWLWSEDVARVRASTQTLVFDRAEVVPWTEAPATPLERLEDAEAQARYEIAWASLGKRHRAILERRADGQTYDEIGAVYSLSGERIRGILADAIQALQRELARAETRALREEVSW